MLAPLFDQRHHRVAVAPGIGIDGRLLREIRHDDQHILGNGRVAIAEVQNREMAVVATIPPRQQEVGRASGLAGVGPGDDDQAGDSLAYPSKATARIAGRRWGGDIAVAPIGILARSCGEGNGDQQRVVARDDLYGLFGAFRVN